jgi:ABC-type sugar transport system ATPase subunit
MLPNMALEVQNISYKYPQGETILDSVSLLVGDSEMLALVGPSGCGKSTLLHCIAGLIEIDSGKVSIDAKVMNAVQVHQRGIGIMMQDQPLYEHLSVEQNIAFPLRARGNKTSPVAELMDQLDLTAIASRKVSRCSGGERRRIALARTVVIRPKVLLLDEPFISIDPSLRVKMKEYIQTLHTELKASTIIVSHHHDEVEQMCTQRITMEQL